MSSPKLRKPDRFSTATIVWGIIFLMGIALIIIAVLAYALFLFNISVWLCIVSFFGMVISFATNQDRKARYKQSLMIRKAEREQAIQQQNQLLQRQEWERHHGAAYFTVKGVTFTNDDGSSRQKHLKALHDAIAIEDYPAVEFIHCKADGEDAVRILAGRLQIGFISTMEVDSFLDILPRIESARLDVESFVPADDPHKIYRADVYVVYSK